MNIKLLALGIGLALGLSTPIVLAQEKDHKIKVSTQFMVEVNLNPKNIVSLDFGALDTLKTLGVSVKAYPKESTPNYLKSFVKDTDINAGGMKTPNFDELKALKPELIIITGRQGSHFLELSNIAPTLNLNIDSNNYFESVKKNALILASLIEQTPLAETKLAALESKAAKFKELAAKSSSKTLVLLHNDGNLMVLTKGGYTSIIFDLLGLPKAETTIFTERKLADSAYLNTLNPDYIFLIDRSSAIGQKAISMDVFKDTALANVAAIKNKKTFILQPDLWYLSGGGLESLDLQLDEIISNFKP
ncbi:putative ABC transporter solute-binding protein YclQ [Gammaproteobacteria bacterium]|nr:putative ABC transporter solute-binding protein YclQ [Gammaproteobacteria bacterium]